MNQNFPVCIFAKPQYNNILYLIPTRFIGSFYAHATNKLNFVFTFQGMYPSERGVNRRGLLTEDNDALASELCVKVNSLRELSLHLGEEVRDQNAFLDGSMADMFARSEGLLRGAMRRVGLIRQGERGLGGACSLYCQLLAFALLFFLLCWVLLKFA